MDYYFNSQPILKPLTLLHVRVTRHGCSLVNVKKRTNSTPINGTLLWYFYLCLFPKPCRFHQVRFTDLLVQYFKILPIVFKLSYKGKLSEINGLMLSHVTALKNQLLRPNTCNGTSTLPVLYLYKVSIYSHNNWRSLYCLSEG